MTATRKNTVTLETGRGPVELTYFAVPDRDGFAAITGEAYFKRDDMIAKIKDGEFRHPYTGTHFRIHVPLFRDTGTVHLEVREWRTVATTTAPGLMS